MDEILWEKYWRAECASRYYGEMAKIYKKYGQRREWTMSIIGTLDFSAALVWPQYMPFLLACMVLVTMPFIVYHRNKAKRQSIYMAAQLFQRQTSHRYKFLYDLFLQEQNDYDAVRIKDIVAEIDVSQQALDSYISRYIPYTEDKKIAAAVEEESKKALGVQ